ncbi:MAG TPA: metallophosphoesterase family protein [Gemmatimonadales bacterium]|nr:metallophosphoesterase family protein [Gemmatimonadales bacterium]
MPIAILADIHANLPALEAVLADVSFTASKAVHCGDIVGYNSFPGETIARLRSSHIDGVHGNHDLMALGLLDTAGCGPRGRQAIAWTREEHSEQDCHFLAAQPGTRWLDDHALLIHSSFGDPVVRLQTDDQFRDEAARLRRLAPGVQVCFTAHTHRQLVVEVTARGAVHTHDAIDRPLTGDSIWFVNPGSVGEPRTGDQRAAYAVFDPANRRVRFRQVAYDRGPVRLARAALHGADDPWGTVLVTGADQHQGLAVIRGLGEAGIPVVACGASRWSLGFHSRYATQHARYTPALHDPAQFTADIVRLVQRHRPELLIPTVESTLVLLNDVREELERYTTLAAPPPAILDYALDKLQTLRLAHRMGVPAPRTIHGGSAAEILDRAPELSFPVAIKPRGPALHATTQHRVGFKVRYARNSQELERLLRTIGGDAPAVLVQELAPGVGRCVSAVCKNGEPLATFVYSRDRELPHSGGISVMRKSIEPDPRLVSYATTLLRAIRWQGVAMVEFKYDAATDRYTLMEINGRFQASAALSLDAGLNYPHLVASLFTGRELPLLGTYRVGVTERWLRGDLLALTQALVDRSDRTTPRRRLIVDFCRDFRPGVRYDEFRLADWKPGVIEAISLALLPLVRLGQWIARSVAAAPAGSRRNNAASTATQRAIRA